MCAVACSRARAPSVGQRVLARGFYFRNHFRFHTLDDLIDQLVFPGLFGRHEAIAIRIAFDLVQGVARVLDQNMVQLMLDFLEFLGMEGTAAIHAKIQENQHKLNHILIMVMHLTRSNAIRIAFDLVQGVARVLDQNMVQLMLDFLEFLGMDQHISAWKARPKT